MNGNHRRTLHSTKNNHEPGSFPSRMWKAHAKCYRRTVNTELSLNGDWKFNWAPDPERPKDFYQTTFDVSGWDNIPVPSSWNIDGIQKDGSLKYGVPIYVNQPVIFMHKVKVDDWRGGVMRTPPTDWTTYKYRNEVGSYRRDFDIPQDWDGREVFINFDGVSSFFYLWINGQYVGFSKNSRNTASVSTSPLT